jgi:hypothetical protein
MPRSLSYLCHVGSIERARECAQVKEYYQNAELLQLHVDSNVKYKQILGKIYLQ